MLPRCRRLFPSIPWLLPSAGCGLLLVAILVLAAPAAEPSPLAESTADAALKALQTRIPGTSADLPRLRKDLLAFRLAHPGMRASLRAAALLAELPSPLDRLTSVN